MACVLGDTPSACCGVVHFLILEGAQAGLSWSTILNRREGYRLAFDFFDPVKVAMYDQAKIDELLEDSRIIRNKLKVHSAVTNAQLFLKVQQEFGSFSDYIWSFVGGMPLVNQWKNLGQIPSTTPQSDALSKDLKRRGFKFVGSTIMYAHMQATGLVNDHVTGCFRYEEINEVALQPDFRKSSPELGANPQGSD